MTIGATSSPSPSNSSSSPVPSPKVNPKIAEWNRGHRRDKNNYTPLKSERDWDSFNRKLIIQAAADGIDTLLIHDWQPSNHDEETIDKLQNKYFFAVLEHILLTDRGKTIIRHYMEKKEFNARAVYADLVHQMTQSTKAKLKQSSLLDFVVTSKFGVNITNVTAERFILSFRDKLRMLDELTPINERIPNPVRLTLLQNAVEPIEELRRVKTDAELLGQSLDYFSYCDLLESAAATYDNSNQPKTRRQVQQLSLLGEDPGSQDFDSDFYKEGELHGGIDLDHELLVNKTDFRTSKPPHPSPSKPSSNNEGKIRIPKELWFALNDDAKQQLKDYNAKQPNTTRKINLTEFEDELFGTDPTPDDKSPADNAADDTPLLDLATGNFDASDADIRNVLSAYKARRSQSRNTKTKITAIPLLMS